MLMHINDNGGGKAYFIVPGGAVTYEIAEKLIARPDVMACQDGLFPGCDQTWQIRKAA